MRKHYVILTWLLLVGVVPLLPAGESDIKSKERALEKLRREIDQYEQRIRESEKKEQAALERLDNYEKQTNLIKSLLHQLVSEEEQLRTSIAEAVENITFLEKQLEFLKLHYAKYVTSVYKFGRVYDLETLLSSRSINQLYIRIEYLKRFSEQRRKDLQKILVKKEQIEQQRLDLQEKLEEERRLISEKSREGRTLQEKVRKRKQILGVIRKDKTMYRKELDRKTRAAQELENLIADLIEKERIRKEHEAQVARERAERLRIRKDEVERAADVTSSLDSKRGKLPWPVSAGAVVAHFGNHVHPVLRTVTQNTGIDISIPSGTPVKTVADGEIAMIHWLPSYGNLIIINHSGGFHTVYAHLSDITVIEGQQVSEGSVIAKSGDSVGGSVLHFEVWKEKEKQNPEVWLARR